ncbi:MAG: sigma-54-dependent Fis family transcriptional regulator [Planctomycetota bacterium]|nr:sigma-54-dependent Fis family transcriptional regulator [Planctomycetota bacterium]
MQVERILVVDDDNTMRGFLTDALRRAGCDVTPAEHGEAALALLAEGKTFDLVLTDIRMGGPADGLAVLAKVRETSPQTLVALMTAHATLDSALEAMHQGAFDYLTKPISPNQLEVLLAKASEYRSLVEENRFHRRAALRGDDGFEDIVGRSEPMKEVFRLVDKIAPSSATVLITGESGTGKELIARAIHQRSPRVDKPFIRVNCAALPETLLESELFGHEKGAFTGAADRRPGRFELAHQGTLLLDEISETSLALQSKLLRVLQEREFERVGGTKTLKVDVRVVCTSNRNLRQMVKEGTFREDLFYRLNVVPLHLPPLRERERDVLLIAEYFVRRFSERYHRPTPVLNESGRQALCAHEWPGNVREMENTIERAVLLCEGRELGAEAFALGGSAARSAPAAQAAGAARLPDEFAIEGINNLAEVEKRVILRTLRITQGNRTKAAQILGISVRTLYTKLREYEGSTVRENELAEMTA